MTNTAHSPLPWTHEGGESGISDANGERLYEPSTRGGCESDPWGSPYDNAGPDGVFIVRAVNNHDALLAALKGLLPQTFTGTPTRAMEVQHWEHERDLGSGEAPAVLAAYAAIAAVEQSQ